MRKLANKIKRFRITLRVANILAIRQIFRGNIWINILIISVMALSAISLIGISGILVGILEGSFEANREQYTGDVFISTLSDENSIKTTGNMLSVIQSLPQVDSYSVRYKSGATIEANYQTRRDFNTLTNSVGVSVVGIVPEDEDSVTGLSNFLIEGEMISSDESGYIVIGSTLLKQYSNFSDLFEPLVDVYPGSRVKVSVTGSNVTLSSDLSGGSTGGANTQEFIVKGVVKSKVDQVSIGAFITESDYRRLTGKKSLQAQEIAIKADSNVSDESLKYILSKYEIEKNAKLQTATEAIPKFLDDIKQVFSLLGLVIGSIGIVVASITVFIVIYINALTRRKFIGILKGIGITRKTIEWAYVMQSFFYGIVGSAIALAVIYFVGVPYFAANPLNFPFSDGILSAPFGSSMVKIGILIVITIAAGFIPAWLIARRNTLDSILLR